MKEDSMFTQGVTMKTMGNEGRHIVHTRVTMQTIGNEGSLIIHTRSYNANNG
ncbi:hypothetical protein KSS87_005280 [Heliosperma pusillum]|nr:hypothetical protein KSS87_005280 [Heliosperma pusillum]